MKFTYLLVNLFSVMAPLVFSFHPKIKFNRYFKEYFIANLISASCFIIWDAIFTARGIWGFNENYTLGLKIFNLPMEEILFFFCIPFACIFTYHCITLFYEIQWKGKAENIFVIAFSFSLFILGGLNFSKAYTSTTFIGTAILLLLLKFVFKVAWLQKFFSIYPLLLIPFFIVNGILTGFGLEQPVVWYNNAENLNIRLFTIPVEDVVYGMELLILTLFSYEKLKTGEKSLILKTSFK